MRRLMMGLIRLYQRTLSFDHGPLRHLFPHGYCRFHPTCSEYGYQAYARYGILKGTVLTAKRVLKCHPFHPPGLDPVPETKKTP